LAQVVNLRAPLHSSRCTCANGRSRYLAAPSPPLCRRHCRQAGELLGRLPEDYIEDEYKVKLQKLGGLAIPLNIFLFQEIQRLQRVIGKVRFTLSQLQLAIKGEVVMSEELQDTLNAIYDARVARLWTYTIAGDEFSWILPTLGLWFSSLIMRDEQSRTWLNSGRPNVYWLTGFFNPQVRGVSAVCAGSACRMRLRACAVPVLAVRACDMRLISGAC
jgi:Dynein heavy chain C-terminal domain